jgi:hypothetical protein
LTIVGKHTGTYGSYTNFVAGSVKSKSYGFALLIAKGTFKGVIDIKLTVFGLSKSATLSTSNTAVLCRYTNANDNTFTVKCSPSDNSIAIQFNSSSEDDYNVVFPVFVDNV